MDTNTWFPNVADMKANDGTGRTYREINNAKQHAIPIGALVEFHSEYSPEDSGFRAFVVLQARDCDGTPMYSLSLIKNPEGEYQRSLMYHGHDEDSLTIIRLPQEA